MASKRRNVFYQNKKQETTEIGFLLAVAGGATFALNLLTTDAGRLVAFCALEAFGALVETVLFVCVVELFPVAVRGTALSITVTSGRVGAVLGNILMGTLIDTYCTIPVYMFATSFIGNRKKLFYVGAVVAATLPDMRRGHG
ncbi:hypothetical protein AAG570_010231 [Ranatra chinensis]|uniref:Major facilitator superfamily (MFS) profile domain-containing protein n=1 Tax=Ranatra chinensis TaxID=642074 RepID=A0ABD0YP34_9HEMI